MMRIGLIALLAAVCAAPAYAQTRSFEPVVPRGLPDQRGVEPAGELPQPATTPPARAVRLNQNARRTQSDADARHCLERASNRDIHRCAHPYLSRSARAAVVRTRARQSAEKTPERAASAVPRGAETPKFVDAPGSSDKGGGARPEDKAKAANLVKPIDVTRPSGTPKPVESTKAPDSAKSASPPATEKKPLALPKMGSAADPTAAK